MPRLISLVDSRHRTFPAGELIDRVNGLEYRLSLKISSVRFSHASSFLPIIVSSTRISIDERGVEQNIVKQKDHA